MAIIRSRTVLTRSGIGRSSRDSLVAPLSLINALIVATVLKKKDEVSDTFRRLELVWNRDGVYTNRDREIMGNIEDDDK